jgi:hypothetical protein
VKLGQFQVSVFCDNLLDSHTLLNYAQVQPDSYNPSYNQALPNSVQQNDFTYRPRTIGVTFTYHQ